MVKEAVGVTIKGAIEEAVEEAVKEPLRRLFKEAVWGGR